ncbi:hypothetical protein AAVH_18561 [Aphelenchoides avenae]|nr:hypothetical protein AAVH_18561 [Aphelenchus avenae]
MRPVEVLEQTFLLLGREDIEAVQISDRRFHIIISSESFQNVTPLLNIKKIDLREDNIAIWRNDMRLFDYDSEETVNWLRNACVEHLCIERSERDKPPTRQHKERSQRWLIPRLAALRVITIEVALPFCDHELQDAFFRPDKAHPWMSAMINDASSGEGPRVRVPLVSSSLANTETLSISCGCHYISTPNLRVTTEDLLHWLHRPQAPREAFSSAYLLARVWERRNLSILTENIDDGDLQRFIEATKETFASATTKLEYDVSIWQVSEDFGQLVPKGGYRKFNRETGELMTIEFRSPFGDTRRDRNHIYIRRRPFL